MEDSGMRVYAYLGKKGNKATFLVAIGDSEYKAKQVLVDRYGRDKLEKEFGVDIDDDEPKFILLDKPKPLPCCGIQVIFGDFNMGLI